MEKFKKQAACLDLKSEMYFPETTSKALLCLSGIAAARMGGVTTCNFSAFLSDLCPDEEEKE